MKLKEKILGKEINYHCNLYGKRCMGKLCSITPDMNNCEFLNKKAMKRTLREKYIRYKFPRVVDKTKYIQLDLHNDTIDFRKKSTKEQRRIVFALRIAYQKYLLKQMLKRLKNWSKRTFKIKKK